MGKIYRDKKSAGCALCKPHKHGWAPKKKIKTLATEKKMAGEIIETLALLSIRQQRVQEGVPQPVLSNMSFEYLMINFEVL